MRSIKTYLEILRKKGLYMCLREAKKAAWPIWWTHNRAAIEQIQAERTSKYLLRHYKNLIHSRQRNRRGSCGCVGCRAWIMHRIL